MYQFSSSIAEGKKRGTLISEVEIIPNVWNYAGKEITFEEAWLERMPKAYFARPFALCIRIDQGKEVFKGSSSAMLVAGEKERGFWLLLNPKGVQLFEFLDSEDLTHLRASLVQDYDEERQKNIRFVRKDKKGGKSDVP